jgi:hypothetical protein
MTKSELIDALADVQDQTELKISLDGKSMFSLWGVLVASGKNNGLVILTAKLEVNKDKAS